MADKSVVEKAFKAGLEGRGLQVDTMQAAMHAATLGFGPPPVPSKEEQKAHEAGRAIREGRK